VAAQSDLLIDAHLQLLARDDEIGRFRNELRRREQGGREGRQAIRGCHDDCDAALQQLRNELALQVRWAARSAESVLVRDDIIRQLQARVAGQTAWAQQSVDGVARRDEIIASLQTAAAERDALVEELKQRVREQDVLISRLQRSSFSRLIRRIRGPSPG